MKILLVNALIRNKKNYINIGTSILGTILQNNGYDVEILDFNYLCNSGKIPMSAFEEPDFRSFSNYILDKQPNVVCFSTMINSYHFSILVSKYIKRKCNKIKVIFGGPQASLCAFDTMKYFNFIDMIIVGEGERSIINAIKALNNEINLETLKGVFYRKQNEIEYNLYNEYISNLDDTPIINYDLVPYAKNMDIFPLDVGRGCPFSCKYCSTKSFWKRRYRLKSSKRIISEIKAIIERYGIKKFNFEHDLFTFDKQRIIDFCENLINEELDIKWHCSCRLDTIDEEMIKKMSLAGCTKVFLGIETGSELMQKITNKNLDLNEILEKITLLNFYGIKIKASFIYGFPEEKYDDLKKTLNIIRDLFELNVKDVILGHMTFLPETEYYNEFKNCLKPIPDNLYLTLCDEYYTYEHKKMFLKYPTVFTHFYTVENPISSKFVYLSKFITYYVPTLKYKYSLLYYYLMEFYSKDLSELYLDMNNTIQEFIDVIIQFEREKINKEVFYNLLRGSINKFINTKDFNQYNTFFHNIFNFENDMMDFVYLNNENNTLNKVYSYDVINIKRTLLSMEKYNPCNINIRFVKDEDRKLRIQIY